MRITKLDWWVYKLFYWRWNKILKENPAMLNWFIQYMGNYQKSINKKETKCLPTYSYDNSDEQA